MRESLISNPACEARAGLVLSAILTLALSSMAIGQQQEIKAEAKDQKPLPKATGKVRLKLDKPAEPTLEDMLNKALKDNPDIKVAEAKVREADAELNRVRLQVTQKVLTFHHTREAQKATVKVAADEVARMR